jgi:hypothetical protein
MMSVICFGPFLPVFVAGLWIDEKPEQRRTDLGAMLALVWLYPLACAAWAFALRGGLSLNFFGVRVRRVSGGLPSRWQFALRVLGLFAPAYVAISLAMLFASLVPEVPAFWGLCLCLGILWLVLQPVAILVHPTQAPHDSRAGTVLVPS